MMEKIQLFNGKNLDNWVSCGKKTPAPWTVGDGEFSVVPLSGNIMTKETFSDAQLHVEFMCPYLEGRTGQSRSNSGVYLQGCYEIQVLDSWGNAVRDNECGGIYSLVTPLFNASARPDEWQTYDIVFRAARFTDGKVSEPARLTLIHNGIVIHNNVIIPTNTPGGIYDHPVAEGPLMLQDHGDVVHFRNIWMIRL